LKKVSPTWFGAAISSAAQAAREAQAAIRKAAPWLQA
jgi:hypothetical protein